MKKVLVINSSARGLNSHSRKLTEVFTDEWKSTHTEPQITFRELGNADVPHINEIWIAAAFKPVALRTVEEAEALKVSDVYVAELREADVIVIGSPMYNWSIPSKLKAYIDQVMRVNETWKFNPADTQHPYTGLLKDKTLFLLLSRGAGGYEAGEYNEHMNYQSTYLKMVFNIMGVHDIHVIAINGASAGGEKLQNSIDAAHQKVKALIEMELAQCTRQ